MPVVSEAQRRFMYAVKAGKVKGVKKEVGEDYIEHSHGVKDLPERKEHHKHLSRVGGLRKR